MFTTHTPVAAGHEVHAIAELLVLGPAATWLDREMRQIGDGPFNMTVAGLRLSSVTNAVSELHGQTVRRSWAGLPDAAPIVTVTNGVHPWTWQDERIRTAYATDGLWDAHLRLKRELLAIVRGRTGAVLDEDWPVVGVARRATAYKRADLVIRDLDRVGPLLRARKLQLVFGGKAHPQDEAGKRILGALAAAARSFPEAVVVSGRTTTCGSRSSSCAAATCG